MDSRHRSGSIAELFVASRLAREYDVLYPLVTQSRYDLVVNNKTMYAKVQVKKATWSRTGSFEYLQARISGKNKETSKPYTNEDVDYFAFTDLERVWLFPFDVIGHQTSVCLASTNPGYKSQTSYSAEDWLL